VRTLKTPACTCSRLCLSLTFIKENGIVYLESLQLRTDTVVINYVDGS